MRRRPRFQWLWGGSSRRRVSENAVNEEFGHHIEECVDLLVQQGMDEEHARREAQRRFGSIGRYRGECARISRGTARNDALAAVFGTLQQDVHYAVRTLRTRPGFTAAAVLSLALGIGANAAMFSIADSLMFETLPVAEPHRLALLGGGVGGSGGAWENWTHDIWVEIRERPELFGGAFAWQPDRVSLSAGGQNDFVEGIYASGRFFDVLGVHAVLGRTFDQMDDRPGGGPGGPVAVVSFGFWQRRYGGSADVLGRSLTIVGVPFTIVGVTPQNFFGPDVGRRFDVIVPLETEPLVRGHQSLVSKGIWLGIMARLKPSQTLEAATAGLRGVQPQIREATLMPHWDEQWRARYMQQPWTLETAAFGRSPLRSRFQQPLIVLMVVVSFVLLIACANVATLLLVRTATRRHELGVRKALGASSRRLARQCLLESLLLSGMGAAFGLAIGRIGSDLLVHHLSTVTSTVFLDVTIDARVLGFNAAIAIVTALLFGTVPAIRATRTPAAEAFKEGGPNLAGTRRIKTLNGLLVAQVALSLVLVIAAGLFVRTFAALATVDVGFDKNRILVVDVDAKKSPSDPTEQLDLVDRMRQVVGAIPGVESAAIGLRTPVKPSGISVFYGLAAVDEPSIPEGFSYVYANFVTPDWFATYGTDILAGRDFTDFDGREYPNAVIIDETFSRLYFGNSNPIGRYLSSDDFDSPVEIVGLVEDVTYRSLRASAYPMIYLPMADGTKHFYEHDPPPPIAVSVRASPGRAAMLVSEVVDAIGRVDPTLALTLRPITHDFDAQLVHERLLAIVSAFFGALALLLAGIGLFGVTSYAVAQRRAEIGLRMVLGAAPTHIVCMVCRNVALLVGFGVLIGGALSFWVTRFAASLLFGLEPRDSVTFICSTVLIITVGTVAAWLPARRASRIDPKTTLCSL